MEIKFDAGKRLYTNAIRHRFVQGENLAESITITGPKQVGALDLSQLRMAVRVNSPTYETVAEKTLSQTVQGENVSLEWVVDKMFTAVPGPVSVTLVGYGNEEEVIKITSDGILVKADDVNGTAPPESTWEQLLAEMQQFATQTYQNAQAAAASEANAKASEDAAKKAAEQATNAAETASGDAADATEEKIRQFADDRYARALKATEGPAAQLTIYPDEGSSLQITVHGATTQEGEGDPSPKNIRGLNGVGRKMYKYEVTGNEDWGSAVTQQGTYRRRLPVSALPTPPSTPASTGTIAAAFCNMYPTISADSAYNSNYGYAETTNGDMYVYDPAYNSSSATTWKQHLQDLYAAGTPLVIYYVPTDKSQATGWYTWEAVSGDGYAAVGLELDGPLFEGDTINNNVEISSGRQCAVYRKMVLYTLTGKENYSQVSTWFPGAIYLKDFMTEATPVSGTGTIANIKCSHAPTNKPSSVANEPNAGCGQGGGTDDPGTSLYLNFGDPYNTKELATQYIKDQYVAGTPVQILAILATTTTTYSAAQLLIAAPNTEGKVTVTGEGQVSAAYNKSITRAIAELQAAALALGANLSI